MAEQWTYNGIQGHGPAPEGLLGKYKGPLVIIGGGRCVWDDLKVLSPGDNIPLMTVNDIGMYLDRPIKHWVSLHANYLIHWLPVRVGHGLNRPITHSYKLVDGIDCAWKIYNDGGMSGFFAVKIALAMGYDHIVLCGIPMDDSGHFWDPPWRPTGKHNEKHSKQACLTAMIHNPLFRQCIRSMSGWTRKTLGAPDEGFLGQ